MTRVSPVLGAPFVRSGSEPFALVLTVLRLLSIAAAEAVFLFASARSRSNIVSCATLATSGCFFELPQPTPPAMNARQAAAGSWWRIFIMFAHDIGIMI